MTIVLGGDMRELGGVTGSTSGDKVLVEHGETCGGEAGKYECNTLAGDVKCVD